MKAVILAAGLGTRLGKYTENLPKAMIKVLGQELILYGLSQLNHYQIEEVAVVTGFESEKLTTIVKKHFPETKLIYNPDFKLGNIKSLEKAFSFIDDDFLLFNADHIYPKSMITDIVNNVSGITAICDFDRNLVDDDMKVKIENKKLKKIRKDLTDYNGGYIGITFCSKDNINIYKEAIQETIATYGDNSSVEWALGLLAEKGTIINTYDASNIGWLEIDTPEDLRKAEDVLLNNKDFLK